MASKVEQAKAALILHLVHGDTDKDESFIDALIAAVREEERDRIADAAADQYLADGAWEASRRDD